MSDAGFSYEFAIAMPNGELYRRQPSVSFASLFGRTETTVDEGEVVLYQSRAEADAALRGLVRRAADVGVDGWCGYVVQRLCSPFTVHDPAAQFAGEVEAWIEGQSR